MRKKCSRENIWRQIKLQKNTDFLTSEILHGENAKGGFVIIIFLCNKTNMNSHLVSFKRFENLGVIEIIYKIHDPLRNSSLGLQCYHRKRALSAISINFLIGRKKFPP